MDASDYKVFQCPNCNKHISTKYDSCRFCSLPLNDEIKAQAIEKDTEDTRQYRSKMSRKVFYVGIGIFAVGLLLSSISIFSIFFAGQGLYFPWSPIVVIWGLAQMLYGLFDVWAERKK